MLKQKKGALSTIYFLEMGRAALIMLTVRLSSGLLHPPPRDHNKIYMQLTVRESFLADSYPQTADQILQPLGSHRQLTKSRRLEGSYSDSWMLNAYARPM